MRKIESNEVDRNARRSIYANNGYYYIYIMYITYIIITYTLK